MTREGTGGAEIYDYVMNVEKSSYPLAGALIQDIIKHFEDMDVNFAIPYEGYLLLEMTVIFRC